jgi:hypothetical protein
LGTFALQLFMGDDPFIYLRNLTLVATWQVHVLTVSLMALLGVWIGLSRFPWYVGAMGFLGLLLLSIPISAPEPALLLLVGVSLLAVGCRFLRIWMAPASPSSGIDLRVTPRTWNYGLADLLWVMAVVGMLALLFTRVLPMPRHINWTDFAINVGSFLVFGWSTVVAYHQVGWKRKLAAVGLLVLVCAAVVAHLAFANDWWFLADFYQLLFSHLFGTYHRWRPEVAVVYFASFSEFAVILFAGCALLFSRKSIGSQRPTWRLRPALAASFAVVTAMLSLVYYHMLESPRPPQENWPAHDDSQRFRELVARCYAINPEPLSLADVRKSMRPGATEELVQLYASLDEVLERDSVICFDLRHSIKADWQDELTPFSHVRKVVLAWDADAKAAAKKGEISTSILYNMRSLRMGVALQKRGVFIHALIGYALEGVALAHLSEIRHQLTCDQIREVLSCMEAIDVSREPIELMLAREAVFDDRTGVWRTRLQRAVEKMLHAERPDDPAFLAPRAFNRLHCRFALLRTELALHCYHQTHRRWPASLAELSPGYLTSLPLDPFTQQPLIYRVEGEAFVLYSVGEDKVDDGGIFGLLPWHPGSTARDVDLDTWLRE